MYIISSYPVDKMKITKKMKGRDQMDTFENMDMPQESQQLLVEQPMEQPVEQPIPAMQPEAAAPVSQCVPKKRGQGKKVLKTLVACVLVVATVAAGCGITAALVNAIWEQKWEAGNYKTNLLLQEMSDKLAQMQEQIKDNSCTGNGNSVSGTPNTGVDGGLTPGQVYAQNVDAVVAVANQATTTNIYGQVTETASSGSGFIISADGYLVTNHHVVEGASKLTVMLQNGKEYQAKLVGYDAANDMAVLKIDGTDLPYVKLGSSKDLIVGDQVVAIGNPLGELTNSLTVGYVSATDRGISTGGALINMIQTDVAINSGNSGGPLFNMKGEVIGITTAKYSGTSGSGATIEGISFAIPIDDVVKKVMDLVNYGYLTGPYLGVSVSDTDPTYADYFDIPTGAYVREVYEGYCAAKAGLKAKDVIVSLGGYRVSCLNDLSRALGHFNAGDTVEVIVYRGGAARTLQITLDERPKVTNTDVPETNLDPAKEQKPMPENGTMEEWWDYFFGEGN